MKWLKRLGLILLGIVLALAFLIMYELSIFFADGFDPRDTSAAKAALKDTGLSAHAAQADRAVHFDSHGGFHGDGCTITIFATQPGALWETICHSLPGWTVEPIDQPTFAGMLPRCSCHPDVYPAADVVFDAWYLRDSSPEGGGSNNYSMAFYDAQTGLFYFYRIDT